MGVDTILKVYYYQLFVKPSERQGGGYYVYFPSQVDMPWEDVPAAAVKDGDLLDAHLYYVEWVMEITPEEYFAEML